MKRISKLEVSCPDGVVYKKIDFNQDELDKEVEFKCAANTNAVVILDGSIQGTNETGLDWKFHRKNTNKVEIYALSTLPFKVLFGFGGYPFQERKTNLNTNLGFIGQCVLTINPYAKESFKSALNTFKNAEILVENEASNALRASIVEVIKGAVGTKFAKLNRAEVESKLYELKNEKGGIADQLESFFASKGLDFSKGDFTISVNFPADFEERYQEVLQSRADTKNAAKEIEILNSLKDKK